MTAEATPGDAVVKTRATPAERRATAVGIVLILLGVFVFWVFGLGTESGVNSTFNLSLPGERFEGLTWAVNSRWLAFIVAAMLAFLGGLVLRRSHMKWTNLALAIGLALFALAFLTWAASGKSFNLVGMLRSTVILSVPVTSGGPHRSDVRASCGHQHRDRGTVVDRRLRWHDCRLGCGNLGWVDRRDADGRPAWSRPCRLGDQVPDRSNHRRCCDQHLRPGPHFVPRTPCSVRGTGPEFTGSIYVVQDPDPWRHSDHRTDVLRPQPVCVRHFPAGDLPAFRLVLHAVGSPVSVRSANTPRRRIPSASTSIEPATAT